MSTERVCHWCDGRGTVTVYEPWELARRNIDMESWVAGKYGDGIVSLDVAGSYPVAVRVPKGKRALAAIESELSFWPMKLDDELGEIWVNPLNGKDGFFYEPPDPRFYEEEVKQA